MAAMRARSSEATSVDDAPFPTSGGSVALVATIFTCEVGASLLVVLTRQTMIALVVTGMAVALALHWARRRRQRVGAASSGQVAAARSALAEGRATIAWSIARDAVAWAPDRRRRNAALAVMVKVAIEEKNLRTARELLGRMGPAGQVDPLLEAAIEKADGGAEDAIQALLRARRRPAFGRAAARRLVELCAEENDLARAVEVALDCIDLLAVQDLRNMIASLEAWGAPGHAETVAVALALRAPLTAREISLGRTPDPIGD
jgi:uncharacterized protein YfiM (DUF2279 family)